MLLINTIKQNTKACCHLKSRSFPLSLRDVPSSKIIIDCDKPCSPFSSQETKCDFLLFVEGTIRGKQNKWAVPIEKKGNLAGQEIDKAIKQLQSGADKIDNLIGSGFTGKLIPILVFNGRSHKAQRGKLRKKICFQNNKLAIEACRYKSRIADHLK